ncbi:hypothetical protein GQR58_016638 [Nymphon striatum]|nr:hypothetical protein GQR58_016638 [Nymphon striatum]
MSLPILFLLILQIFWKLGVGATIVEINLRADTRPIQDVLQYLTGARTSLSDQIIPKSTNAVINVILRELIQYAAETREQSLFEIKRLTKPYITDLKYNILKPNFIFLFKISVRNTVNKTRASYETRLNVPDYAQEHCGAMTFSGKRLGTHHVTDDKSNAKLQLKAFVPESGERVHLSSCLGKKEDSV